MAQPPQYFYDWQRKILVREKVEPLLERVQDTCRDWFARKAWELIAADAKRPCDSHLVLFISLDLSLDFIPMVIHVGPGLHEIHSSQGWKTAKYVRLRNP